MKYRKYQKKRIYHIVNNVVITSKNSDGTRTVLYSNDDLMVCGIFIDTVTYRCDETDETPAVLCRKCAKKVKIE